MTKTVQWEARYFTPAEMACKCGKCGGLAEMNQEFMNKLDLLRAAVNRPIPVSSGYRCAQHTSELTKTTVGAHRQGRAVDIPCSGPEAFKIIEMALELGFTGIGVSQNKRGARFIHLDDAPPGNPAQPRPTFWSY